MNDFQFNVPPAADDFGAGEAAATLKLLAHGGRLLVLCHLASGEELSAGELTRRIGLSQSSLSQHLGKLRQQRMVATRKHGQSVFYRIADPRVTQIIALLHDLYCPDLGQEQQA